MTINQTDNTLTATRDEMTTIIDKALDRKLKAMPDRSAISSLSRGGSQPPDGLQPPGLQPPDAAVPNPMHSWRTSGQFPEGKASVRRGQQKRHSAAVTTGWKSSTSG